MLSLDISCHHQIRLKQQSSTRLSTIIESILDTNVANMCMPPLYLPCLLLLYRILPYLLTLIVGVLVVLSFGLYPPSGCTALAYLRSASGHVYLIC